MVAAFSQIIFVNWSTMTTIASILLDLGNGLMMSMLISCHDPWDISNRCSSPNFLWCWTLFCWHLKQPCTHFWHLPLALATSSFSWSILAFVVILDALCPLSHDNLVESFLWVSCCLGYIFSLPYIQLCLFPMITYCPSLILGPSSIPWCCSFWFLSSFPSHLL